jgi:uncharacterized lipoprotein YajG
MRTIVTLALLASSVMLAGCFHHGQAVYAEPLPPPPMSNPPLK